MQKTMQWTLLTLQGSHRRWPSNGWIFPCIGCSIPTSASITIGSVDVAICRTCTNKHTFRVLEYYVNQHVTKFRSIVFEKKKRMGYD
jgi:hypothetical protein